VPGCPVVVLLLVLVPPGELGFIPGPLPGMGVGGGPPAGALLAAWAAAAAAAAAPHPPAGAGGAAGLVRPCVEAGLAVPGAGGDTGGGRERLGVEGTDERPGMGVGGG
jgi:hypothetical protein